MKPWKQPALPHRLLRRGGTFLLLFGVGLWLTVGPTLLSSVRWAQGAYTASSQDVDGNVHLASNNVQDVYHYDTATDSSADTQQQLGVDPNWKNGVVRKSSALRFDDSNDYVITAGSVTNGLVTDQITVEFWYKPDMNALSGYRPILINHSMAGGFLAPINNGTLSAAFYTTGGTCLTTPSPSLSANTWYHFAAVYDGSNCRGYLNGQTWTGQSVAGTIVPADLSLWMSGPGSYISGVLDEVRISNSVRYRTAFAPQRRFQEDTNTLGLWHFDEESGTTARDSSAYGNDGTLMNGSSNSPAADGTSNGPIWVTGSNAIMDGFLGPSPDSPYPSQLPGGRSGAGNLTVGAQSSVTSRKSFEVTMTRQTSGLSFDGSNDYAITSAVGDWGDQVTVDFWTKDARDAGHIQTFVGDAAQSGTVGFCWIYRATGSDSLNYQYATGSGYITATASNFFTGYDNQYVHVAIVADYTNKFVDFYRNGELAYHYTTTNSMVTRSTNRALLLGAYSPSVHFLTGRLDEVRISNTLRYNGAFTPSRRLATDANTIGLWHLDEGTGTTSADASGNGYTATFRNGSSNSPAADGVTQGPIWVDGVAADALGDAVFYHWRDATGGPTPTYSAWSVAAALHATTQQLGTSGVFLRFNPQGRYSVGETFRIASWAVEAFSTASPARGKRRSFPDKANLVGTNNSLDIIDAATNTLWMRFPAGAGANGNDLISWTTVRRIAARNGHLYVGVGGMRDISLASDSARRFTDSGNAPYQSTLAERGANRGYAAYGGLALATGNEGSKGVAVTTIGANQYVAVASVAGPLTVVGNATADSRQSLTALDGASAFAFGSFTYQAVALTSQGTLYAGSYAGGLERFDAVHTATGNQGAPTRSYGSLSTPALRDSMIWDIAVSEGASLADGASNQVALATDLGVEVLEEHSTQSSGFVEHYAKTGETGSSGWSSQRFGAALSLNGTSQYVNVPHTAALNAYPLTAEAWIYPTAAGSNSGIVTKYAGGSNNGYNLFWDGQKVKAYYYRDASNNIPAASQLVSGSLPLNTWHHVAFVVDDSGGQLFINGVLADSRGWTGTPGAATTSQPLTIGKYDSWYFPGLIDEVRISNTARYTAAFVPTRAPFVRDGITTALYHFDERYGGVAGIAGQSVYDDSGNNNNGTLGATATASTDDPWRLFPTLAGPSDKGTAVGLGTTGDAGRGLQFDGSNDYVAAANETSFDFERTQAFTLSLWEKTASASPAGSLILLGKMDVDNPSAGNARGYALIATSTAYKLQIASNSSNNLLEVSVPRTADTAWHHLVATYDGSSSANGVQIYVDGVAGTKTVVSNTLSATILHNIPVEIGARDASSLPFSGSLADARIYTRALTGAEAALLYNGGAGQTDNPLSGIAGWWTLRDGSGSTAADASGAGHVGTLMNGSANTPAADGSANGPLWTTGAPVKEQSVLWVGTNGAGAGDGAVTAASLRTGRQVAAFTTPDQNLPSLDITSLSTTPGGTLALVGTEGGAWNPGTAGFVVEDAAVSPATVKQDVRLQHVRLNPGTRLK